MSAMQQKNRKLAVEGFFLIGNIMTTLTTDDLYIMLENHPDLLSIYFTDMEQHKQSEKALQHALETTKYMIETHVLPDLQGPIA